MSLPPGNPCGAKPRGERLMELNWGLSAETFAEEDSNTYIQRENARRFRVW
jgi:hypothetical protein